MFFKKITTQIDQACEVANSFPWHNASSYADWLAQTYFYVRHSTRLLALAASRFDFDRNNYHSRFLEHLREEKGHENLALRDHKILGVHIKDFKEYPETAAFYQSQYYWLEHHDPVSFMGWIYHLEAVAAKVGTKIYEKVCSTHGKNAGAFLKTHASEDQEHIKKADQLIQGLTGDQEKLVLANLIQSQGLYEDILSKCAIKAMPIKKAA